MSKQDAEANAKGASRWLLVTNTRADETDAQVNYRWDGKLIRIEETNGKT